MVAAALRLGGTAIRYRAHRPLPRPGGLLGNCRRRHLCQARARWVQAPGRALLAAVRATLSRPVPGGGKPGLDQPEVESLREDFALPGMLILQFAFDGNPENPYLSHRHSPGDIVYTGTHDNDTTLGWFESLDEATQASVYRYFNNPQEDMPWMLIRQAMASPANTAIVPWQDFPGPGRKAPHEHTRHTGRESGSGASQLGPGSTGPRRAYVRELL